MRLENIMSDKKRLLYSYISFVSLLSIYHLAFPEYIPLNNRFGFEGYSIYLPLTKNFTQLITTLDSYSVQRALPFGLGWAVLSAFNVGAPITDNQIFNLWIFFNYLQVVFICFYWSRISTHLNLGKVACLTGFSILVLNFPTLKLDYYYNFNYDRTALLFGLMVLYYYIKNKNKALLITSIISLSIWPTFILINTILLLFPSNLPLTLLSDKNRFQKKLSVIISLFVATFVSAVFYLVWKDGKLNRRSDLAPIVDSLLPVSIFLAGIFIFFAIKIFLNDLNILEASKSFMKTPRFRYLSVAVLVCSYLFLTIIIANNDAPARMSFIVYLGNFATGAIQRPLQFLFAHILYFGPGFFLLIALSRNVVEIVRSFGLGLMLISLFIVIQSLNCESRQMINLLPVIALLVAIAIEKTRASYRFLGVFIISSLVISKVWLRINPDPSGIPPAIYKYFPMIGSTQLFPAQKYFMNFGPWMSLQMFMIQSGIVLLLCALIYYFLKADSLGAKL